LFFLLEFGEFGRLSFFFHSVDPATTDKFVVKDKFIARIEKKNGHHDFSLGPFFLADLDNDGVKEVIFTIMAGFPLKPRQLFSYNIKLNQLKSTPDMGWFYGISEIKDVNEDGYNEILVGTYAIDNYPDSIKSPKGYHSAWLVVFDHDLNYLFPPKEFPGQYVLLLTNFFPENNKTHIALIKNRRTRSKENPSMLIYNLKGEMLKSRDLDDTTSSKSYGCYIDHNKKDVLYLIRENGRIEELDAHLEVKEVITIEGLKTPSYNEIDLDKDGVKELLFIGGLVQKPVIVKSDFSNPVILPLPIFRDQIYFDRIQQSGCPDKVFIQHGDQYFICSYEISIQTSFTQTADDNNGYSM